MEASTPSAAQLARPRRTILAPIPDELPSAAAATADVDRTTPAPPATDANTRERQSLPPGRGSSARDEKPDSSTKAYLWRRNIRFVDKLILEMEDNGARPGDINRSVVIRAAITALEEAGLGPELARCADERQLCALIIEHLKAPRS
ncbi:MAG TPA: hypothetical protein VFS20_14415 [Longimicrobium sp.]|nr:hypothetical protein [Longimicrobium sp.]